jgi:hypothetical protein
MGTPTAVQDPDIDRTRGLCMDAVQKTNSGHRGAPMGLEQLFTKFGFTPDRAAAAARECLAAAGSAG